MKNFKKFLALFLFLLAICVISSNFLQVNAVDTGAENVTETGTGKYYISSREDEDALPYGVVHYRDIGMSTTTGRLVGAEDTRADGGLGESSDYFVPGQFYQQQVNVLEVKPSENVKVVSWANLSYNKWTLSTVKSLAANFEANNKGWKVIGAVNGDFFDIQAKGNLPYQSSGVVVSNGENYKTSGGATVGFTKSGENSLIGNTALTRNNYLTLSVYDDEDNIIATFPVEQWNADPGENQTAVYFGKYSAGQVFNPREVLEDGYFVEEAEKALPNNDNDFYGKGVITSTKAMTVRKGQFGIVTKNQAVDAALSVGTKIRVQFDFSGAWEGIYNASGCGDTILYNGEYNNNGTNNRHPRTIIGEKADGTIVMVTVDGRQGKSNMYGLEGNEMAAVMKHYGCVEAYNLDGGGSTTLIIKQNGEFKVCNSPSDGSERTDSNAILIAVREPEIDIKAEISQNSLNINIDVTNENGHDFTKLFAKVKEEIKEKVDDKTVTTYKEVYNNLEITNGNLALDKLESNSTYVVNFIYEDSGGNRFEILTTARYTTLKTVPIFYGVKITSDDKKIYVETIWDDPDLAYRTPSIKINGKNIILNNGVGSGPKQAIGSVYETVEINLSYTIDGKKYVDEKIYNPDYVWGSIYTSVILNQQSILDDIYN